MTYSPDKLFSKVIDARMVATPNSAAPKKTCGCGITNNTAPNITTKEHFFFAGFLDYIFKFVEIRGGGVFR